MAGNTKAKKKIGKSKLSKKPSTTQDNREKRAVDLPSFLKEFDALLDKKISLPRKNAGFPGWVKKMAKVKPTVSNRVKREMRPFPRILCDRR